MAASLVEQVFQKPFDYLGGIAVPPVVRTDAVADLAGAVLLIEKAEDAYEPPRFLQPDC